MLQVVCLTITYSNDSKHYYITMKKTDVTSVFLNNYLKSVIIY